MQLYSKNALITPRAAGLLGSAVPSLQAYAQPPVRRRALSVATGKVHSEKAGFARLAGPTIEAHAATVSWVTYGYYFTLIMCRYSASLMSELAASFSSGEIRLDCGRVPAALTFQEEPQDKELRGCAKWQPQTGPHRSQGNKYVRADLCSRPLAKRKSTGQAARDQSRPRQKQSTS